MSTLTNFLRSCPSDGPRGSGPSARSTRAAPRVEVLHATLAVAVVRGTGGGTYAVRRPQRETGVDERRPAGRQNRRHHPVARHQVQQLEREHLRPAQYTAATRIGGFGDLAQLDHLISRRQQRLLHRPELWRVRTGTRGEYIGVGDVEPPGDPVVRRPLEGLATPPGDPQNGELPKAGVQKAVDQERLEETADVSPQGRVRGERPSVDHPLDVRSRGALVLALCLGFDIHGARL
jgi:hypothetical protein